jgi:hypothetical protein
MTTFDSIEKSIARVMRRHDMTDQERQKFIDEAIQGKNPKLPKPPGKTKKGAEEVFYSHNDKYTFTGETLVKDGFTLRQIQSRRAIGNIPAKLVGGWIGSESNLCALSPAWVFPDSFVYDKARVSGLGRVYSGSIVRGWATVSEKAKLHGRCLIEGNARILGNASLMDVHATEGEWTGKHFGDRDQD